MIKILNKDNEEVNNKASFDKHLEWLQQVRNEFGEFAIEFNIENLDLDNYNLETIVNQSEEPLYRNIYYNFDNNDREKKSDNEINIIQDSIFGKKDVYQAWSELGNPPILRRQNAFRI